MVIVLALVVVLSTFCFNFNVLLPVLAQRTLHSGSVTLGVLSALFGAGALVGALAAAAQQRANLKVMLIGGFVFAGSELLLAPGRSVAAVGVLLFVTGLGFTLWTSNSNSSLQLAAPDHLRGRVVGLYFYAFNGCGPLGGILAGLDWLAGQESGVEWIVSVPGDCPFLPGNLVEKLHAARRKMGAGVPLACARSGEWRHPVVGLWPLALREDLRKALIEEDLRKIEIWTARHGSST
jgi:MFS family permease